MESLRGIELSDYSLYNFGMNKLISRIVAIFALLAQVSFPMWWAVVFVSYSHFWFEGIMEGGILGKEIVTGVDQAGNSVIGKCLLTQPCSYSTLLWGLFSIFSIIAAIVAIRVSFSIKMEDPGKIHAKRDVVFFAINLITIILVIFFVYQNGGFIPRL